MASDALGVGTRTALAVSLPLSDGMILGTALAAPVDEMRLLEQVLSVPVYRRLEWVLSEPAWWVLVLVPVPATETWWVLVLVPG